MSVLRRGNHVCYSSLGAGELTPLYGRRYKEIDIPKILHVLPGPILSSDLYGGGTIPKRVPPLPVCIFLGAGKHRSYQLPCILRAVIVRRCYQDAEMAIFIGPKGDLDSQGSGNN